MALQPRPPVITIMGHVDHGKTTLLDYLRKSRITAKEAGGITQHIGAYQIEHNGKKLTFIDTPGHAAFNKMRERGATITDIVILVVAADDGVKPQTVESIRHIKKSGAAFLVAINKMDLPDVNLDIIKSQLAEHEIIVQSYGGDVETVEISAKTGKNIDSLLDTLADMAELMELTADPEAPLEAVVIESTKDPQQGSIARVIVQQGTLKVRQDLEFDGGMGRVRALTTDSGDQVQHADPGTPVEISGLNDIPPVGTIIHDAAETYKVIEEESEETLETVEDNRFADLDFDAAFGEKPKIKLIVYADVEGTLEAIKQNLDEESVELIFAGVGHVSDRDIEMAATTGATIIAFHTKIPNRIKEMAQKSKVKVKQYDVIYSLIEDLQKQQLKLLEPTIDEVVTGEAEILQIFEMKGERIAGCKVKTGSLKKGDLYHLKRGDEIISDPVVKSMRHGKDEIDTVTTKSECGIVFKDKKQDFQVGDMLVAFHHEDDV